MTEYKCKRGFKIDISKNKCHDVDKVQIADSKIRAFCAFCKGDGVALIFEDGRANIETACVFLRADLSWDDCWENDMYEAWRDEE